MASPGPVSSTDADVLPKAMDNELSIDDFGDVIDQTWSARKKWYFIGVRFEIPVSQLDVIEENNQNNVDKQFKNMIKKWLEMGGCTWRTVYGALRHHTVEHDSTAEELKKWLSLPAKGRKRKAAPQGGGGAKKVKLDESKISEGRGPACPEEMYFNTATYKGCAYFSSGDTIHEFDVASKNWTKSISCPHALFSLATIGNELLAVGGVVITAENPDDITKFPIASKVLSMPLEGNEQNKWIEKYPAMEKERVMPKVVVFGKYLIVLGGFIHDPHKKPIISVEVLDTESKCWYSNDRISLPEEFSSMHWLSACICGEDLYIAARHDDPQFRSTIDGFMDTVDPVQAAYDSDYDEREHNSNYDPEYPCPCYSLYRCSVNKFLQASQEDSDASGASSRQLWQKLDHPHPSIYKNTLKMVIKYGDNMRPTEYFPYNVCMFTLTSISDTLVAVGCSHIDSVSPEDISTNLHWAYYSYRETQSTVLGTDDEIVCDNNEETVDTKCHIYIFNTKDYSWKCALISAFENGKSDDQPSVAVVGNKLVIVRNSKTVQIVEF